MFRTWNNSVPNVLADLDPGVKQEVRKMNYAVGLD